MHTHKHTHTITNACTNTYARTQTRTHTHARTHTNKHTHTNTHKDCNYFEVKQIALQIKVFVIFEVNYALGQSWMIIIIM